MENTKTPYYYYDINILRNSLQAVVDESSRYNYKVHYAIKANANPDILEIISSYNLGADCVSGNEITRALETGFLSDRIVYAGVGKSDEEIITAIENDIFCFNCESSCEIEVINDIAQTLNKNVNIALRINPNIDAKTHKYITTGLRRNKFGINVEEINSVIDQVNQCENITLIGIHFHIGSQINNMNIFKELCLKINTIQTIFINRKVKIQHINVGGGLGINYEEPEKELIANFKEYFKTFADNLKVAKGQDIHFELGRSIVGQCGFLISKVLYTKETTDSKIAILDAGMSDLLRPALYNAYHKIENINSNGDLELYDIVGPICESADTFGKDVLVNEINRNDLIKIHSVGAYGEVMASEYNLRRKISGRLIPYTTDT